MENTTIKATTNIYNLVKMFLLGFVLNMIWIFLYSRKFYMDAIPMVGTGAAVRQITQLIMNNDVTGALTESWLVSLSFIQHPTKDMLTEIAVSSKWLFNTRIQWFQHIDIIFFHIILEDLYLSKMLKYFHFMTIGWPLVTCK